MSPHTKVFNCVCPNRFPLVVAQVLTQSANSNKHTILQKHMIG